MSLPDLIGTLQKIVQDPDTQRTVWDILISIGEIAAALAAISALLWWLVGPRIKAGITEIVRQVDETHHSVTVNGGKSDPPTLRDEVGLLREQQESTQRALGINTAQTAAAKQVATEARDELREHIANGERYLGKVELVLREKGIQLPPTSDE